MLAGWVLSFLAHADGDTGSITAFMDSGMGFGRLGFLVSHSSSVINGAQYGLPRSSRQNNPPEPVRQLDYHLTATTQTLSR